MPSRLVFICPRGTTSAGIDFSTRWPTERRSSVRRAALVWPPAVSTSTLHFERQSDRLRGLPGQHHRCRAGIDHHRRGDAVDLGAQRELAALSARDLHGGCCGLVPLPQYVLHRLTGARDLLGIAIGHHRAGGRRKHDEDEQDAVHSAPPPKIAFRLSWAVLRSVPGRLAPCERATIPSPPGAPRLPCCASARSPEAFVRIRSRACSWDPSYRLRYTAFLCSSWNSEMVSVSCARAPVTTLSPRS